MPSLLIVNPLNDATPELTAFVSVPPNVALLGLFCSAMVTFPENPLTVFPNVSTTSTLVLTVDEEALRP